MAEIVKRVQENKLIDGQLTVLHRETEAGVVLMKAGGNVETAIENLKTDVASAAKTAEASGVTFADGDTFQQKLDSGKLKGDTGAPGANGTNGKDGTAATISVGTVTTGEPGTSASVKNSGTASAAKLDFVIPKGATGGKGDTGPAGKDATINGYNTVTLKAGRNIELSQSGGAITIGETDETPKIYIVSGQIMTNDADTFHATGNATVVVYRSGLAVIDFSAATVDNTMEQNFHWGLSLDLLRRLNGNIPLITPLAGGRGLIFTNEGLLKMSTMGYGLSFRNRTINSFTFWQPRRTYTEAGAIGDWPSSSMAVGYFITGTVYGTVQGSAAANALKSTMIQQEMQDEEYTIQDEVQEDR